MLTQAGSAICLDLATLARWQETARADDWLAFAVGEPLDETAPAVALVRGWIEGGGFTGFVRRADDGALHHCVRRSGAVADLSPASLPLPNGTNRDPAMIGPAFMALYALQGDEPLEWVGRAAGEIAASLGRGEPAASDEAHMFLILMAEMFGHSQSAAKAAGQDFRPQLAFTAKVKRARAGAPVDRWARGRKGNQAAALVERLTAEGWPVEAAIADAMKSGLSRSEVFRWRAKWRKIMERAAARRASPGK